ncbi:MAG: HAD-IA family hydrolase [Acidobacteria bacterium]|nr:HAD-IA family hydrolase [Acidobacteriota bacterium]
MENRPQAMIFDLDGVITFTARVHAAAWKELFDHFLDMRAVDGKEPFREFTLNDYLAYVDGKPRYDGVSSFLSSRAITLPWGHPSDPASVETICGLGNRKDELFMKKVRELGVEVDQDAVRLVRELRNHGILVGLASSSRNAVPILDRAGIRNLFASIVDGVVSDRLHLRGKPQPDIFLQCLSQLTAQPQPARSGIVEDAIAGVQAGERGGFGLVLGVDRGSSGALAEHGANWVISSFRTVTADQILSFFKNRVRAA